MLFNKSFIKWLYFSLLVIMFGSAFLLIELSLKSFSPSIIALSRVSIAALVLFLYSMLKGYSYGFVKVHFILLFILGLSGTTIPFYLISWAQMTINSSETGILIGFMPIFTIIGSHYFFKYEQLTANKVFGFILGFIGLFVLLINNENSINFEDNIIAKIAVIFAAFFYALNALLVKKIKNIKVIPLSAIVMILSSLQLLFFVLVTYNNNTYTEVIYIDSLIALLFMAIFSTAIATVIYYKIIHDYGPNFLSLVNYPIPIYAFFSGVIFLDENINIYSIISLVLVVIAIYISQKNKIN